MALLSNNNLYYKIVDIKEENNYYIIQLNIYNTLEDREKEKQSISLYNDIVSVMKTQTDIEYASMVNYVKEYLLKAENSLANAEDENYVRNTYPECKIAMDRYADIYREYYHLSTHQKYDYKFLYEIIDLDDQIIESAIRDSTPEKIVLGISIPFPEKGIEITNLYEYCYSKIKELNYIGDPQDV